MVLLSEVKNPFSMVDLLEYTVNCDCVTVDYRYF